MRRDKEYGVENAMRIVGVCYVGEEKSVNKKRSKMGVVDRALEGKVCDKWNGIQYYILV